MSKKGTASKRRRLKGGPVHAGMPSPDSVREILTKVAPTGRRFRILKTTETDSYDKPKGSQKNRR